ncbi:MAG: magnesium transporter [Clostridiales bacterium]|nr:magnesium transporter [Clostridiales bacterium]
MDFEQLKDRLDALLSKDSLGEMRGALMMLNVVDIASYMDSLEGENLLKMYRILPKDISADVFSYLSEEQQQRLMRLIGETETSRLLGDMYVDDAVDFLEELPANLIRRLLKNVDEEQRRNINSFLEYPENSAGSIMTAEFCEFHEGIIVRDALRELKKNALDKETIYTLYVLDPQRRLIGTLPLRRLLIAPDDAPIEKLMTTGFVSARTLDDREYVAELVRKYDLLSVPIVDNEGRMVGIVTADDILDVIRQEATEDIEKMNALLPSESEYLKTKPVKLALNRLPWLLFMMVSSILTETIIDKFSAALTIAFSACIPMLMGTGGNSGSQSSTLAIRGLALNEISPKDALKVLLKEARVSIIVGAALSLLCFGIQTVVFGRTMLEAGAISAAMLCTVILAKTLGAMLPLLAKKLKFDPALMAAPLITTLVDVCSLLILVLFASKVA